MAASEPLQRMTGDGWLVASDSRLVFETLREKLVPYSPSSEGVAVTYRIDYSYPISPRKISSSTSSHRDRSAAVET